MIKRLVAALVMAWALLATVIAGAGAGTVPPAASLLWWAL